MIHQSAKTIFRIFFACVIFLITAALFLTVFTKSYEYYFANNTFSDKKNIQHSSTVSEQLVLVSNNQKPDESIYLVVANNGYIAKFSCQHYTKDICIDDYNQSHTRQIQNIDITQIGNYKYISQVSYIDSKNSNKSQLKFSDDQIKQFYKNDVEDLKYTIFVIFLFAIAALYVSIRIIRNFKTFIHK